MMLRVPDVLTRQEVAALRTMIDDAPWVDGNATSGAQSALAKHNRQLPEASDIARKAGDLVLASLEKSALFVSAALPLKVYPPLFNRYGEGDAFGAHVDNAIRIRRGGDFRIRTDLSATLFLSEPEDYDGGELHVEDTYGVHAVKLAAGDMILYPASSHHSVTPITRGMRVASFFWIQSMIRDDARRALLFEIDTTIQSLSTRLGASADEVRSLTGAYHNLLRMWAEM